MQVTFAVGLLISLIIGANAISGERENGTFESLLVTPVSRRQIILGKFLAALSPWPFILAISTVYMALLAPTAQTFWLALLLVSVLGSVLMIIFAGFGLLVSIYSNSNRSSLSVSLVVLLLSLVETQLPSGGQTGNIGYLFKRIDPIEATLQVTEKVLVNNRTITEMNNPLGSQGFWLLSPLLVALLVLVLLFAFGHAHLSLHARLSLGRQAEEAEVSSQRPFIRPDDRVRSSRRLHVHPGQLLARRTELWLSIMRPKQSNSRRSACRSRSTGVTR